jgi:biopolymer transport protein TolR
MSNIDHGQQQVQINVTPLVDVLLVLLIIFMVTAPMIQQGVNINLPKTKKASSVQQSKKSIVVAITKSGKILVDKKTFSLDTLLQHVDDLSAKDKTQVIQVKGDKDIVYDKIFQVMNKLVMGGYQKLSLIAETQ